MIALDHANQMHKIRNLLKFFCSWSQLRFFFLPVSLQLSKSPGRAKTSCWIPITGTWPNWRETASGFLSFWSPLSETTECMWMSTGYSIIPSAALSDVLKVPANWCDIVSLHPNVKACTYRELPGTWLLTFYIGRKVYQPPEDTHQVIYHYRKVDQQQGYLDIILSADAGPFGTKDHRMRFEALPLDGGRTFVHVSYEYSDSLALRLAEKVYFATLGWGKAGFTVTGTDRNGNPVYIGGPRGAIERNAVRYYFAIQSFMDTLHYPDDIRFSMRTGRWYDLTNRYRRQLFEMEKKDYVTFKTKEHKNQVILQRPIRTGLR